MSLESLSRWHKRPSWTNTMGLPSLHVPNSKFMNPTLMKAAHIWFDVIWIGLSLGVYDDTNPSTSTMWPIYTSSTNHHQVVELLLSNLGSVSDVFFVEEKENYIHTSPPPMWYINTSLN